MDDKDIDNTMDVPETEAVTGPLQQIWDTLAHALSSGNHDNQTLLGAMAEVKLETATKNDYAQSGK